MSSALLRPLARQICTARPRLTPRTEFPSPIPFPSLLPINQAPARHRCTVTPSRKNKPKMSSSMTTRDGRPFDRAVLESLVKSRLFYTPAFEIYPANPKGLFDYGPPGCALQNNIVDMWRRHFVLEENMLEVDCTMLTPEFVLKTSGHVDKFADWMVKDPETGEFYRADHLVEEVLENRLKGDKEARGIDSAPSEEDAKKKKKVKKSKAVKLDDKVVKEYEEVLAQIDNYDGEGLGNLMTKYDIRSPSTDKPLPAPEAFNLMFSTSIGPSSAMPSYMRPETAQGQFLNFRKLYDFNNQTMPFASASVGKSFRNEISPRSGLLRVREFLMAEVEHYVDPQGGKKHPRFGEVEHIKLDLLDRHVQLSGKTDLKEMTIGEAVKSGVVDNETLGYFMARIQLFLDKIGIDRTKVRFRQHMQNEMAHYATDCWDAELLTSYGWIECVGCADRSAYDLSVHAKATRAPLHATETLTEPVKIEEWVPEIDKKKFGPLFKKDSKPIEAAIEALSQDMLEKLSIDLKENGKATIEVSGIANGKAEIDGALIKVGKQTRVEHVREFTPNVIEPSFGIGRILYALIEHSFWTREGDEARNVLSFPPSIAPTKVLLVPLSSKPEFVPLYREISADLRKVGIANRVDDSSASIGKRYSRNDELGTPYGVTLDFQSLEDKTVTLRERDSTKQVRAEKKEIIQAVLDLVNGNATWEDIMQRLPVFEGQELSA